MQIQQAFDIVKDDLSRVEAEFKRHIECDAELVKSVGTHILESGGKRIRPLVHLLAAKLCGYKGASHIPMAVVVEFIHTATLLHDDVVDSAKTRRGRQSANAVWGNGPSILVGDFLLSKAFALAVGTDNLDVLKLLASTTTRMAEGEVLQLKKHSDVKTSEAEYINIITGKTAALFAAATGTAAILAGATTECEKAAYDYGMELGIAYQLVDDCLDYTSTEEALGKPAGNDLKEGRVTLPMIKAYGAATQTDKKLIEIALEGHRAGQEFMGGVYSIIKKHNGVEYTMAEARARVEKAKNLLAPFGQGKERAALDAVADFVIERKN